MCCREQCRTLEEKLALSLEGDMNDKGIKCWSVFSSIFFSEHGICVDELQSCLTEGLT